MTGGHGDPGVATAVRRGLAEGRARAGAARELYGQEWIS
ncbi:hypothetical protein MPTA5024_39025 [Microbispora sp. ATCC PTA-5024]|nr:hypothetical protein MPTA5024_39025 [Microbispora sp. ATCC PTA-5024]